MRRRLPVEGRGTKRCQLGAGPIGSGRVRSERGPLAVLGPFGMRSRRDPLAVLARPRGTNGYLGRVSGGPISRLQSLDTDLRVPDVQFIELLLRGGLDVH